MKIARTGEIALRALLASSCIAVRVFAEPPPPAGPLTQVHEGMDMAAVTQVAGPPTDTCTHITGKAFIPLYPGNDKEITELHYEGRGRVILSGGGVKPQVIRVEYDSAESGHCGSSQSGVSQ